MTGNSTFRPGAGSGVTFFAPSVKRYDAGEFSQTGKGCFVPVSLTGGECALMCDHCQGQILKWMRAADSAESLLTAAREIQEGGAAGLLISGGSDRAGIVPLESFLGAIGAIRQDLGLKVMVHTGRTSSSLAAGLAGAGIDAALIDIIGSAETIWNVCHLDSRPADYERSLCNLTNAGVPVSPHVVIGLDRGRVIGEIEALKMIARYPVSSLVLVGLRPLPGTPMSGVTPPAPAQFAEIFHAARELFPETPVLLGCERPAGDHKVETDRLALAAGLDGVAFPSEETFQEARRLGLEVRFSESCCALMAGAVT